MSTKEVQCKLNIWWHRLVDRTFNSSRSWGHYHRQFETLSQKKKVTQSYSRNVWFLNYFRFNLLSLLKG